eukprot:c35174_g1_i1 orf=2-187(-)
MLFTVALRFILPLSSSCHSFKVLDGHMVLLRGAWSITVDVYEAPLYEKKKICHNHGFAVRPN